MSPQRSILPNFDVFRQPPVPTAPPPGHPFESYSMMGTAALSPALAAVRGLGDDAPPLPPGVTMPAAIGAPSPSTRAYRGVLSVVVLGVVGYLSYEAGKAMTPRGSKDTTWGWVGVPVGLLTGPIGLGIMGIVSNHRRG